MDDKEKEIRNRISEFEKLVETTLREHIDPLAKQLQEARRNFLHPRQEALEAARQELREFKSPFKVGDLVTKDGFTHRVKSIVRRRPDGEDSVIFIAQVKKNGEEYARPPSPMWMPHEWKLAKAAKS